VLIYAPPFQSLLGTAALMPGMLLFVAPFPFIVWGADELRRWMLRRGDAGAQERSREGTASTGQCAM
jgi:hypothetical protein